MGPSTNGGDSECDPADVTPADLSVDAVLELVANQTRRNMLLYLRDRDSHTAEIETVIEYLLRKEAQQGKVPGHAQLEAELIHVHLPKMADLGVISYDEETGKISYTATDRIDQWLDRVHDFEQTDAAEGS